MIEATKENPSPLDAFETAKPDEPIWTVQGGDPLGPKILQLWAWCARARAGVMSGSLATGPEMLQDLCDCIARNPAENKIEADALLIRASETEKIKWAMEEYQRGTLTEHEEQVAKFNEFDRLDIHDVRRRCAGLISQFFSELNDHREKLIELGWLSEELDNQLEAVILLLKTAESKINIRRKV